MGTYFKPIHRDLQVAQVHSEARPDCTIGRVQSPPQPRIAKTQKPPKEVAITGRGRPFGGWVGGLGTLARAGGA